MRFLRSNVVRWRHNYANEPKERRVVLFFLEIEESVILLATGNACSFFLEQNCFNRKVCRCKTKNFVVSSQRLIYNDRINVASHYYVWLARVFILMGWLSLTTSIIYQWFFNWKYANKHRFSIPYTMRYNVVLSIICYISWYTLWRNLFYLCSCLLHVE